MGGIDRRRLAVLMLGAGLVLAGCGGGGGSGGSGSGASAPTTTAAATAKSCLEGGEQSFSFPAADGPTTGVVLGQGRTGVVLGHQAGSDLCEWLPQARRLATHGRQVLAFDFGPYANIGKDMIAAAAELRRRGADRLVLVGSSMGGTAAIEAAAEITPRVAGVVSLSGPEEYQGADADAAAPKLRVPVLFIVAEEDPPFADAARASTRPSPATTRSSWSWRAAATAPPWSSSATTPPRFAPSSTGSSRRTWTPAGDRRVAVDVACPWSVTLPHWSVSGSGACMMSGAERQSAERWQLTGVDLDTRRRRARGRRALLPADRGPLPAGARNRGLVPARDSARLCPRLGRQAGPPPPRGIRGRPARPVHAARGARGSRASQPGASARGYRVVYDEDVRRIVASLPAAGKQSLADLFRELTRDASLLERLGAGPAGQEAAYPSAQELLVAYRVDNTTHLT